MCSFFSQHVNTQFSLSGVLRLQKSRSPLLLDWEPSTIKGSWEMLPGILLYRPSSFICFFFFSFFFWCKSSLCIVPAVGVANAVSCVVPHDKIGYLACLSSRAVDVGSCVESSRNTTRSQYKRLFVCQDRYSAFTYDLANYLVTLHLDFVREIQLGPKTCVRLCLRLLLVIWQIYVVTLYLTFDYVSSGIYVLTN